MTREALAAISLGLRLVPVTRPRYFYGAWPELERIEVGDRAAIAYDEPSSIEHRLAKATGTVYGCPPRHWAWVSRS